MAKEDRDLILALVFYVLCVVLATYLWWVDA